MARLPQVRNTYTDNADGPTVYELYRSQAQHELEAGAGG